MRLCDCATGQLCDCGIVQSRDCATGRLCDGAIVRLGDCAIGGLCDREIVLPRTKVYVHLLLLVQKFLKN